MLEGILVIFLIYGGLFFLGWLFNGISDWSKKHKEDIRNQVAEELLAGRDIKSDIEKYKNKLAHLESNKIDSINEQIDGLKVQLWGTNVVLMKDCPECKEGSLIVRKGQYGKFLGCTKYPKCKYTKNISEARVEYKQSITEEVVSEINRAYSKL